MSSTKSRQNATDPGSVFRLAAMSTVHAVLFLLLEGARYVCGGSTRSFHEVIFDRIANHQLPFRVRSFLLGFVVLGRLRTHSYDPAFTILKEHEDELPWKKMSYRMVRRIFETAIIFGEQSVARRCLRELCTRPRLPLAEMEAMRCIQAWSIGAIADESVIDLSRIYFAAYPAYDEWFKGRVLANTGRLAEAQEHFRRCLALAPPEAAQLRDDVMRRL